MAENDMSEKDKREILYRKRLVALLAISGGIIGVGGAVFVFGTGGNMRDVLVLLLFIISIASAAMVFELGGRGS